MWGISLSLSLSKGFFILEEINPLLTWPSKDPLPLIPRWWAKLVLQASQGRRANSSDVVVHPSIKERHPYSILSAHLIPISKVFSSWVTSNNIYMHMRNIKIWMVRHIFRRRSSFKGFNDLSILKENDFYYVSML